MRRTSTVRWTTVLAAAAIYSGLCCAAFAQSASGPPVFAGIFGSRELDIENPNNPGTNYEMVLHINDPGWYEDELAYNENRGYGFEAFYEDSFDSPFGDRNGSGIFGPFDDSPNNRTNFGPEDDVYNSFIGFKSYTQACDEFLFDPPDRDAPCSLEIDPEGGIFRVDVPNGKYRFVAVVGDSNHNHAARVVVEDGGEGEPVEIGENHVTLINNFNQADYARFAEEFAIGRNEVEGGTLAVVGFDDKLPPAPQSLEGERPVFIHMDRDGMPLVDEDGAPTDEAPDSPVLEVTQGYLRLHLLQGNSNPFLDEETDILYPADANGGDLILFEVYPVEDALAGDYNGDGLLDAGDLDLQADAIGTGNLDFDLNGDGTVDSGDRFQWVKDLKGTWVGDANFDGEFNSGDFVTVFQVGKFEQDVDAGWAEGDFNGDKRFNSGDFVSAFQDGGFEQGPLPAAAVSSVPEPSSMVLLLVGMLAFIARRRR